MTFPQEVKRLTNQNIPEAARKIGDENLNLQAMRAIQNSKGPRDRILAVSGYKYENNVIALTDERMIIANEKGQVQFDRMLKDMQPVAQDGRTLIFHLKTGEEFGAHMGNNQWVADLVRTINNKRQMVLASQSPADEARTIDNIYSPSQTGNPTAGKEGPDPHKLDDEQIPIAEKVQFWQEQDRINQALIPRVVRQSELLSQHVGEHENLPLVAAQAVSEALKQAREEADAILREAKTEREEQASLLETFAVEREQQAAQYQAEREELQKQHEARREEQTQLLEDSKTERHEQNAQHQNEMTALTKKGNQMRNLALGSASVATITSLVAILLAILT